MKKCGVMNSGISGIIADMGHTDLLVVCDSGYPIPSAMRKIDISLSRGLPSIVQTITEIAKEMQIERIYYAEESEDHCKKLIADVLQACSLAQSSVITHQQFKEKAKSAVAIIRTGECVPYSNIILQSGTFF